MIKNYWTLFRAHPITVDSLNEPNSYCSLQHSIPVFKQRSASNDAGAEKSKIFNQSQHCSWTEVEPNQIWLYTFLTYYYSVIGGGDRTVWSISLSGAHVYVSPLDSTLQKSDNIIMGGQVKAINKYFVKITSLFIFILFFFFFAFKFTRLGSSALLVGIA